MRFNVVRNGVTEELDVTALMLRYDFSKDYPKIKKMSDQHYLVFVSDNDYLEEKFLTLEDADLMSHYISRLAYNIQGIWRAGG